MKHTITHNGFHGYWTVTVNVDSGTMYHDGSMDYYIISAAVARRINRMVCGGGDCRCGEGIAQENERGEWMVPAATDIRGNYPQS